MAIITRAPRSIRERAKIITVMEPGKVYSGHFIYQPVFMPVLNADGQTEAENQEEPNITKLPERKLAKA
jgi:hypothetical protein